MGSLLRAGRELGVRMMGENRALLVTFLVCLISGDVLGNICSLSYCKCEDSDVSCQGGDKEDLKLTSSSLLSSHSELDQHGQCHLHDQCLCWPRGVERTKP